MPELSLRAYRGNWQQFASRRNDGKFAEIKKQIFERDRNSCVFCGFASDKYQEIINLDHNYLNNDPSNLASACSLCYPCLLLDGASMSELDGFIIFLPEISQLQLNHFCRLLFCSMLDDKSPYSRRMHSTYLSLKERKKQVENAFGSETFQPAIFGQAIIDSNLPNEAFEHGVMSQLRLLPTFKELAEQVEYWQANNLVGGYYQQTNPLVKSNDILKNEENSLADDSNQNGNLAN